MNQKPRQSWADWYFELIIERPWMAALIFAAVATTVDLVVFVGFLGWFR